MDKIFSFLKSNRIVLFFGLVLFITVMLPETSWARTAQNPATAPAAFQIAKDRLINLFNNSQMVLFVIGGFGLIGLSFQAVFGKVKWGWFSSLAFGLAIIGIAGSLINWVTNDTNAAKGSNPALYMHDPQTITGKPIEYVDPSMEGY